MGGGKYSLLILLLSAVSCSQFEMDNSIDSEGLIPLDSLRLDSIPIVCHVEISGENISIKPWYSYEDKCCYFFIPSSVNLDNVFLSSSTYLLHINGVPITSELGLRQLGINTLENGCTATITGNWDGSLPVRFIQSRNVSTLSINTESGSLDYIHKDKNNVEPVNIALFDESGEIDYMISDMSCTLKGRGHGTWSQPKKPYLLKLPKSKSILGMNKSKKWVLLANAADETNLRTWIAFRLGNGVGLEGTPQGKFTDVYANGDYLGLYYLTEKASSKLVAKNNQEPILVRIDNSVDKDSFKTDRGTIMEVDNPGDGEYSIDAVRKDMNRFERLLFSGEWLGNVDIDSWAKKYIIDEITENGDAGYRSNYFYYFPGRLYVYGGPIWDYDLSLGRSKFRCGNPQSFVARREWLDPDKWSPHYSLLLRNELFYKKVTELYASVFLPTVQLLIHNEIQDKYYEIENAIRMNAIRWLTNYKTVTQVHQPVVRTVDELVRFLNERVSFLNSAWLEGHIYHLVQMTYKYGSYDLYTCYSVKDGYPFSSSISVDIPEFAGYHWADKYTGEDFNPSQIVTRDREFVFK